MKRDPIYELIELVEDNLGNILTEQLIKQIVELLEEVTPVGKR